MNEDMRAGCTCSAGDAPRSEHSRLCPTFRSLSAQEQAKVQQATNQRAGKAT